MKSKTLTLWLFAAMVLTPLVLFAQDAKVPVDKTPTTAELSYTIDNVMLFLCAVLVIFMQAGFAMLTAGLSMAKNTVNILFKNFMDLCVAILLFSAVGFSIMYPGDTGVIIKGWFGFKQFGLDATSPSMAALVKSYASGGTVFHPQVDFLFQVAFAGAAATIVAGSVAGRMKFGGYLVYTAILTGLVYPISGMWKWGGGWLDAMNFHDFAGSLIVHSVGGFAGLAGAIVLGPRIGKFSPDGKPRAMPGHNLALATLGTFILWLGWYGFNPGSQLAFAQSSNISATMLIAVNTTLAAASGAFMTMLVTWIVFKKPELSMTLNGALAGLVAITANCDGVTNMQAVIIGLVAGVLVVVGVKLLDMVKIDDPVGAWPVHGLNGIWGGIATGIFHSGAKVTLGTQILGSLVYPAWAFGTMLVLFFILKAVKLLRVSREEELRGLDISEHGEEAYSGFQIYTTE